MNKLFSKIAVFAVGAAMAIGVGVVASRSFEEVKAVDNVTDTLTRATTGIANDGNYNNWNNKSGGNSEAVYAGQSGGGNDSIQLRTKNNNSGIVTTASGGTFVSVTVVWNSNTANGRVLDVYGKNAPYSSAEDLYNDSLKGTKLGSITYGTNTSYTATESYAYIGLRSSDAAMYLTSVSIVWTPSATASVAIPESTYFGVGETKTITATINSATTEANIHWDTANNEGVISIPENSTGKSVEMTALKAGTAKLVASYEGLSNVECAVTVYPFVEYEKVTNVNDLTVGSKLIVVAPNESDYYAANMTVSGGLLGVTPVTLSDTTIAIYDPNPTIGVFTLGGSAGHYTLTSQEGHLLGAKCTAKTGQNATGYDLNLVYDGTASDTINNEWTITIADGNATIASNGGTNFGKLGFNYNEGNARFKNYNINGNYPAQLFTLKTEKITVASDKASLAKDEVANITTEKLNGAEGTITFTADPTSLVNLVDNGDGTATVTALHADSTQDVTITAHCGLLTASVTISIQIDAAVTGITIEHAPTKDHYYVGGTLVTDGLVVNKTYSVGDPEPAALSELEFDYDFSAVGEHVLVTVTLKGTSFSQQFEVVVEAAPVVSSLTFAQALELAEGISTPAAGGTLYYPGDTNEDGATEITITSGFVSGKRVSSSNASDFTVYIVATKGDTTGTEIQLYHVNITQAVYDSLTVGSEISATGKLAKFKKDANADVSIEMTSSTLTVIELAPDSTPVLTVAEALTRGNALTKPEAGKSTYDTEFIKVSGYVCRQMTWSTQYNNGDVYIGATLDAPTSEQLDIFRISDKTKFDLCKVGAQITVRGKLALFQHATNGSFFVELTSPEITINQEAPVLAPIETNVAGVIAAAANTTPVSGQTVYVSNIQQYAVTGYVSGTNWSTDYNNGTIWFVDDPTATDAPEAQAFRFDNKDIFDQCTKGTQIKVTGLLAVYQNATTSEVSYEITNCTVEILSVVVAVPQSIAYEGTPKLTYELGEALDLSGITKLVVTYSDSTAAKPHTEDKALTDTGVTVNSSAFNNTVAGKYSIVISYTEGEAEAVSLTIRVTVNPQMFTVSFAANGGTGEMAAVSKEAGATYALPACTFTAPAGKEFAGWKVGDAEELRAAGYEITVSANVTVTAQWKDLPVIYTVSFDAGEGTGTMTAVTKEAGQTYVLPQCTFTAPEGKEFAGWQVGNDAELKQPGDEITVNGNVTVTAQWSEIIPTLVRIEVVTTKTEYNVGEEIDKSTLTVTAYFDNGTSQTVDVNNCTIAFDSAEAGENVRVTVTYEGKSYSFYVSVVAVKKGCRGSVAATSIILSTLSLAGVALLTLKKRKED